MKHLSKPLLLVLAGATIAVAIGTAFGSWLGRQQTPRVVAELPAGATVLPQNTLGTISLSTDVAQWQQLRQFGTIQSRSLLDGLLVKWRDRLLTANGYDYERDIQPWVGSEVTLAFFPEEGDAASSPVPPTTNGLSINSVEQLPTALILPIGDPEAAQTMLAQLNLTSGQTVTTQTYKGVPLRQVMRQGETDYATAVLGQNFVVAASSLAVLQRLVDTEQGGAALAAVPSYRQAFRQTAAENFLGRLYVNAPAVKAIATANASQPSPVLGFTPPQNNQGMVATVALTSTGLNLRGANWLPPDSKILYKAENNAKTMPERLPADTLLLVSGGNFRQLWDAYSQPGAEINPRNPLNPNMLREGLSSTTGLNVESDLLSWMDGEFALALLPAPTVDGKIVDGKIVDGKTVDGKQALSFIFLVQASDRPAAEASLAKLDSVMSDRYRFQVSASQVGGQPLVKWISPYGSLAVTHGWLDDQTAFLALGENASSSILPPPASSLKASKAFQAAVSAADLTANNGHFFLDIERMLNAQTTLPLPPLPLGAEAVMSAIRTIGVTAAITGDRTSRYNLNLNLQQTSTDAPSPLPSAQPKALEPSPNQSPDPTPTP